MSSSLTPYSRSNNNNNNINSSTEPPQKKQKTETTEQLLKRFEGILTSITKFEFKNLKFEQMTLEKRVECLEKFNQDISQIAAEALNFVNEQQRIYSQFDFETSIQKILDASEESKEKLSRVIGKLFDNPENLQQFLLKLDSTHLFPFHLILKAAVFQENIPAFKMILKRMIDLKILFIENPLFQNTLALIFGKKNWSDVTLKLNCKDGELEVNVLREVIAAQSETWRALLCGSFCEQSTKEISMDLIDLEMDKKTALAVIEFFYTGELNLKSLDAVISCFLLANRQLDSRLTTVLKKYPLPNEESIFLIHRLGKDYYNKVWVQHAFNQAIHLDILRSTSQLKQFIQIHANDLEELVFESNNLTFVKNIENFILNLFKRYPNLKKFSCSNRLPETILKALDFSKLESLDLSLCIYEKKIHFPEAKNLKFLKLDIDFFHSDMSTLFAWIDSMANLEHLELRINCSGHLNREKIDQLSKRQVKKLSIILNPLSFGTPSLEIIHSFPSLECLTIRPDHTFSEHNNHNLETHYNLRSLVIQQKDLSEGEARCIARIPLLQQFSLESLWSNGAWVAPWINELEKLGKLEQITSLRFQLDLNKTVDAIDCLGKLKNLRELTLNSYKNLDLKNLSLPKLETLKLSKCANSYSDLFTQFPSLQNYQDMLHSYTEGQWSIKLFKNEDLSFAKNIRSLSLESKNKISLKDTFQKIEDQLEYLEELNFTNDLIDFHFLISKYPNIKSLSFGEYCGWRFFLEDSFIQTILQLKELKTLSFYIVSNLTTPDRQKLKWLEQLKTSSIEICLPKTIFLQLGTAYQSLFKSSNIFIIER